MKYQIRKLDSEISYTVETDDTNAVFNEGCIIEIVRHSIEEECVMITVADMPIIAIDGLGWVIWLYNTKTFTPDKLVALDKHIVYHPDKVLSEVKNGKD